MGFFKIKLRRTDLLWTQYIRQRDHYTCKRCGRTYTPDNCHNLGVSHYWGRGRENVRFDDANCDALCTLPCHRLWAEEGRMEYDAYMLNKLGQKGYDDLMLRAHLHKDRDDKADLIILKALLE